MGNVWEKVLERLSYKALAAYGASAGTCIGVILVVIALYNAWPRDPMDDPAYGLTFVIIVMAIPFLMLTTTVGAIVGLIAQFVILSILRQKQDPKESPPPHPPQFLP